MHVCMRISLHVCMDVNIWSSKSDCYFAASLTALIVATRLHSGFRLQCIEFHVSGLLRFRILRLGPKALS